MELPFFYIQKETTADHEFVGVPISQSCFLLNKILCQFMGFGGVLHQFRGLNFGGWILEDQHVFGATVDRSENPRPTTGWMYKNPVNNGIKLSTSTGERRISSINSMSVSGLESAFK